MSPLSGFSDNAFQTRDDMLRGAASLLNTLQPYKSPCGARIKLSTATGTAFDEISAQLEGFARPLWVVADLLAMKDEHLVDHLDLSSWVRGLEAGTDPRSDTYWGAVGNHDQRMVEMEPIAYALLSAPSSFLSSSNLEPKVSQRKKDAIATWLRSINDKEVPPSNWRWFRILVNLALVKSFGVPYNEVKPSMDADFKVLDSFYLSSGWSSDGLWCADKKQADYYSGSFAIQYSQLAYIRFAGDIDPERVQRYRSEAGEFATTFWRYFDVNGAAIPFGRSLTYRFAFAAFWSAVAVSGVPLPPPLNNHGVIKGFLLRHLRWWAEKKDIFNTDGTLAIGYTYPNMYMSEDYNSPQSLYWCLKSFSVLGLSEGHTFWTCEELPHPLSSSQKLQICSLKDHDSSKLDVVVVVHPALQITCSTREHHFLLSAGQFTRKPHRAREAKYGKFAYSSAFSFSVPAGTLLSQMAPDNTLCISNDDGETWKVRWEPIAARFQTVKLAIEIMGKDEVDFVVSPALTSGWQPWKRSELQIETILLPPLKRWPGWHVRIHKITWQTLQEYPVIQLVDAGFAIKRDGIRGSVLPQLDPQLRSRDAGKQMQENADAHEGRWERDSCCLILSTAGASGVSGLQLMNSKDYPINLESERHICRSLIVQPDANTNLMAQRTLIPTMNHRFDLGMSNSGEFCFSTGIFAVSASAGFTPSSIEEMWQDRPNFSVVEYLDVS